MARLLCWLFGHTPRQYVVLVPRDPTMPEVISWQVRCRRCGRVLRPGTREEIEG